MIIVAITAIIYIISIFGARCWVRRQYIIKWYDINPDNIDLLLVFIPIVNTVFSIMYICSLLINKNMIDLNKFFNVEKRYE